jgi:hypothetical protein
MPHSITHNNACLALFNKKWGIPIAKRHPPQVVVIDDGLRRLRAGRCR